MRRDGSRLRITAQLVDATNGSQRWAGTYDRKLGDVFAIQNRIVNSVATTLQLTLRPALIAAAAGGTRNIDAYEAYLSARAAINNLGATLAPEAIVLFERAVRLDPDFALGWDALAEGYTFAADFLPSMVLPLNRWKYSRAFRGPRCARSSSRRMRLRVCRAPVWCRCRPGIGLKRSAVCAKAVELTGPYDYDSNLSYA